MGCRGTKVEVRWCQMLMSRAPKGTTASRAAPGSRAVVGVGLVWPRAGDERETSRWRATGRRRMRQGTAAGDQGLPNCSTPLAFWNRR